MSSPTRSTLGVLGPLFTLIIGGSACLAGPMGWVDPPDAIYTYLVGIPLVGLGLFVWRRRRGPPVFARVDLPTEGFGQRNDTFMFTFVVLVAIPLAWVAATFSQATTTDAWVAFAVLAAVFALPGVFAAFLLYFDHRSFMAALRGLSRGMTQSRLQDGSLSLRRQYTSIESTQTEYVSTQSNQAERRTSTRSSVSWTATAKARGPVEVILEGRTVTLSTHQAWFGCTRQRWDALGKVSGGHRTSESSSTHTRTGDLHVWTMSGDRLLFDGTLNGDQVEGVTLIFATPPESNPHQVLFAGVLGHVGVVSALIALSMLGWALQATLVSG